MKIAWTTDPHLNFLDGVAVRAFAAAAPDTGAEAILITGDIAESPSLAELLGLVVDVSGLPTYFVLGNHDFYRGSVETTRTAARRACREHPGLHWLRGAPPVALTPEVALVGVGGWGDARLGDAHGTKVVLNDFRLIEELAWQWGEPLHARLRALADEDAALLRIRLREAAARHRGVWVATHVPPFHEACWHEGEISDDQWLPWFSCKAVGDVLREAASTHPGTRFVVYCGHTHSPGVARLAPNLVVHTGGAEYARPAWTVLDVARGL